MGMTELILQTDFQDFYLLNAPEMRRRFKKRKKVRKQKKGRKEKRTGKKEEKRKENKIKRKKSASAPVDHSHLCMATTSFERKWKHCELCRDLVTISYTPSRIWPLNAVCVTVCEIGCCEEGYTCMLPDAYRQRELRRSMLIPTPKILEECLIPHLFMVKKIFAHNKPVN